MSNDIETNWLTFSGARSAEKPFDRTEILRFTTCGKIYCYDRLIGDDAEIVEGLRDFISYWRAERPSLFRKPENSTDLNGETT